MSEDRRRLRPGGGNSHLVEVDPPGIAPGKRSMLTPGRGSPGDPGKRAVTDGLRFDPVENLGVLARDAARAIDQLEAAIASGEPQAGIAARSVLARTLPWLRQAAEDPRPQQDQRRAYLEEVEAAAKPLLARLPASTTPPPPRRRAGMFSGADHVASTGVSGEGGPLPHLAKIQASFGRHDLTGVRAHTDEGARDATHRLGALAYATGTDVAFADGNPELHTVAHEAAHVIQQRDGVAFKGAGGDPTFEAHADAVADAVVAGRSAEPLLDAFAGRAAHGAIQRKDDPKKPPTRAALRGMMEHYLRYNHRDVWRSIGDQIHSVKLPTPHDRLAWSDYDAFVVKLLDQLATELDHFTALFKLDDALFPADTEKTIGPILPTTIDWSVEVGMAVAHALHTAIVASIKRLAPRYLQVADSKGVSGEQQVQYTELVTSMAIDRNVGVAMCWGTAVAVKALDPKAAKAAKGRPVGLKKVTLSYPGDKDKSLWNWVRADAPSDATAEDVAAELFVDELGDKTSSAAFLLAAAPPLFGVPKRIAITHRLLKANAPPNVGTQDDSVDKQLVQIATIDARSDEAALHQQGTSGPKPTGAPAQLGKVLDALRDCGEQLGFARTELAKWHLAEHLAGATSFLRRKEVEAPTLDPKHLAEWAPIIDGQKDRLSRISGGIHAVITAANKLGIKDPNSEQASLLREVLELFAVAAGTSHMAQTSEAKLLEALQQQGVLSLRALQATERNMMGGVDELAHGATRNANTASIGHQAVTLQERSRRLQTQLANGEQVDQDELEDVSMKSEEVALDSRVYGALLAIADLNKAARETGSGDAGIIAGLFSGPFRDLPSLTKHIFDELNPIRNNLVEQRKSFADEERIGQSPARKKQQRALRRKSLNEAQARFQKLATDRDLNHFFSNAAEQIKDQQFRTAVVRVVAMIGISVIAGGVARLAARAVGGVFLEATGASTVRELGLAARTGIALTQIGVDTTISSAGTVAIQGGSFGDVWTENLITNIASTAFFGSISRYAAEQADIEGKIAMTWSKASKLGKLGMIGKEIGAITAHTLWGAAMGEISGRLVTGQAPPPPDTLRDWALQGISVAVGKHVSHVVMTKSKLFAQLERGAEKAGRGMVTTAAKLEGLAKRVISGKQPDTALALLNEHDQFLRRQLEAIDEAYAKTGDPTGELFEARQRIAAAAEAVGSQGMLDTKFTLIGMEELVPGALWKGTKEQIQRAIKQAETDGLKPKILSHDETSKRWKLQIGDRTIEIQEVVSTAKTVKAERILLAGSDEELRMAAKLVVPQPGSIDIIVHGGVDDFEVTIDGKDYQLSHRSLAKYIKSTGIKFSRVRLLACKAGMHPKGVAQQLANKLGVTVAAPTDLLWIHPDGTLTIGPSETRNTGTWEDFGPKPSETRSQKSTAPETTPRPVHDDEGASRAKSLGKGDVDATKSDATKTPVASDKRRDDPRTAAEAEKDPVQANRYQKRGRKRFATFEEWWNAKGKRWYPNKYGAKGSPDHQETVTRLFQRAQQDFPNGLLHRESSINGMKTPGGRNITGLERNPDVWVEGTGDQQGVVLMIYEAGRTNEDGSFKPRERAKKKQYDGLGLKSQFEKVKYNKDVDGPDAEGDGD